MNVNEKEFNLLDEKWIWVLDEDGKSVEVSLLEIFQSAHKYRRFANELATVDVAILRLILAIMYTVFDEVDLNGARAPLTAGNAIERWKLIWENKQIPYEPVRESLEYFRERFYLFHPETPFYQVADLASRKCTYYEAPKLIGTISQSGNTGRLFLNRTDNAHMNYAEAARWLLHLNAFDDSSGKASVRGVNMLSPGVGWLGKLGLVFAEGQNVFQTIMLNWVLLNGEGDVFSRGQPVWERKVFSKERVKISQPNSLAELYTLQSRRLLLTRTGDAVDGYKLLGGDFFEEEDALIEQMTLWQRNAKTEIFKPKPHSTARYIWRDFSALIVSGDAQRIPGIVNWSEKLINRGILGNIPLRFSVAGVKYGDKDSFVDDAFSDSVSINSHLLSSIGSEWQTRIVENLTKTDKAVDVFENLALELALAKGADKNREEKNRKENNRKGNNSSTAKEKAYSSLDIPFRQWLASISGNEDMEATMIEWRQTVANILSRLANKMLNDVSDSAFVGRNGHSASGAEISFKRNLKIKLGLSKAVLQDRKEQE
jgi:CRISPR system Cascade subunit CasA